MAPLSEVEAAQGRMAVAVAGVTAAGVLFVALIASGIARTITGPIRELVDGTRRIASGNWNHTVRVPSRDEIGQLAVAFNRMTEQLRASREKLIDAERLATAGQMAATFAHEVRNPLSSIRMMLQLASEQTSEPKTTEYVGNSIEEIDRLNAIVEEMLDFSRPATPNLAPCDVGKALSAVISLMQVTLADHGVEVSLSSEPNVIVAADEDTLKRALLNVLLNATQAQAHGGRIDAAVEIVDDRAQIVIADGGPGFSDEALANLFRPFATTKTRGTGLGLVTTKRIFEQHGGDVRIENRPDGGARVTMSLPMEQP